jgi:spermidine synthase
LLVVIAAGLFRAGHGWDALASALACGAVLWLGWYPAGPLKPATGLLYETESAFNYIQVIDAGPERQLRLNEGEGIHSVYRPEGGRAYGIWDYFLLAPAFNPAPYRPGRVQRLYIAGLAAGTTARLYTEAYGPVAIDGAELDPAIIDAGRRFFGMDLANLNAVAADARRWLSATQTAKPAAQPPAQNAKGPYDVIIVDAYRPPYIPFHLTTVEFFTLVRDHLAADGVVAVNVGRTHSDYSLVNAIAATMQQVFPSVYIVDEPDGQSQLGNSMVVASRRPSTLADFQANIPGFSQPLLAEVAQEAAPRARQAFPPGGTPVFTDDRAPIEQVVHSLVLRQLLGSR